MGDFKKLLERAKMGPLTLENRLIMAPMGSLNADSNGYITDNALAFYKDQAKGGLSMVIVECTATDDDLSRGEDNVMCLYDNGQITGMARLASTIKDQGAVAILQLCHIGHQLSLADRKESLGPSTMFEMQGGIRPFPIRGLTIAEIKQIIDDFGKAAWRAKMAGFDGIEIHGAIGHLINMFCSPQYNHRTDKYGGSPENRIRFMVEIIEACQKTCGKSFPIIGRICPDSFDPKDISIEEGIIHAKALEKTGIVALHLVGGDSNNIAGVSAEGVTLKDLRTGNEELVPCDSMLICRGYTGNTKFADELRALGADVYEIGDGTMKIRCNEKRNIDDAILEGWQVGNRI